MIHRTWRAWRALAAALLMLAPLPADAAGQSSRKWAIVGDWEVWVDLTESNSCFVMQMYEHNAVFRIGYRDDTAAGYVFLANDKWKSLVVGSKYAIEIQFDSKTPWKGNATAKKVNNVTYLYMDFAGQGLIKDMAHSDNVLIKYQDQAIASVRLKRADEALDELSRCQARADRSSNSPGPKRPAPSSNDPFAH